MRMRVFANPGRPWRMSAEHATTAADMLADEANRRYGSSITAVIGIANGGIPPALAIADHLEVSEYHRVTARHNASDDTYMEATGRVSYDLGDLIRALGDRRLTGTILLVDDICGSGATFEALRPAISAHTTPDAQLITVVLCRNAGADRSPDLWIWSVEDWVVFPWEQPPLGPCRLLPTPEAVRG